MWFRHIMFLWCAVSSQTWPGVCLRSWLETLSNSRAWSDGMRRCHEWPLELWVDVDWERFSISVKLITSCDHRRRMRGALRRKWACRSWLHGHTQRGRRFLPGWLMHNRKLCKGIPFERRSNKLRQDEYHPFTISRTCSKRERLLLSLNS